MALGGTLDFNFLSDTLTTQDGEEILLNPPVADELPDKGFEETLEGFIQPTPGDDVEVIIDPESNRLQKLTPFLPPNEEDYVSMSVLMKAEGKCTTDHISPAGKWLQFRGHLENISQNLFNGVNNAFAEKAGDGVNILTKEIDTLPSIAKNYSEENVSWVAVGDENYGEGSSREHAAMEPRFRGCKVVLVKSFARIHEANLKKQGILPLVFEDKNDYEKIEQFDKMTIGSLKDIAVDTPVEIILEKENGETETIKANHSLSEDQIAWFFAGSALNYIKSK